jgi:hypothetical protein
VEPRFGHDIHLASKNPGKFSLEAHLIEKIGAPSESDQEVEIALVGRLPSADRAENANVARAEAASDPENFEAMLSYHLPHPKSGSGSELLRDLRAVPPFGFAAGSDPDHGIRRTPGVRATIAA